MFQYAAGRALSLARGVPFSLDVSAFEEYTRHQGFELGRVFSCSPKIATQADVRDVIGWQSYPVLKKIISRRFMAPLRRKEFVLEPHFNFWRGICAIPLPSYIQGYWQSEKYFEKYATELRRDFTFKLPLTGRNAEFAAKISQTNAVSIHVRRGDYVSNRKAAKLHGLCSIDYYRGAIKNVVARIESPTFFVFSDDIAWVSENLKLDSPCAFVDHNQGQDSFNDMRLMSLCRHNIIANSSFSWWGAWLNVNPNKLVTAPKNWFAASVNTEDLLPKEWISL